MHGRAKPEVSVSVRAGGEGRLHVCMGVGGGVAGITSPKKKHKNNYDNGMTGTIVTAIPEIMYFHVNFINRCINSIRA